MPADIIIVGTNPEVPIVRESDRIFGLIESDEKGPGLLFINRYNSSLVKRGYLCQGIPFLNLVEKSGILNLLSRMMKPGRE